MLHFAGCLGTILCDRLLHQAGVNTHIQIN